jgi:flagellar basal-body rod modification protein FlgD
MTTVNPTTGNEQIVNSLNQARTKTDATQGLEDRFLKLLITQMQNQDPLNPLDNAQVTSQLAQISTVSGIDKLNSSVNGMSTSFVAAQSLQAGGLIGHGVLAPANTVALEQSQGIGGVQLAEPVDAMTVTIRGSTGEAVKTMSLGAQEAGTRTFRWDGSTDAGGHVGDGAYTFEVSALRSGKKVDTTALGYARVQSVTLGGDQLLLNTNGLGAIALNKVKQSL